MKINKLIICEFMVVLILILCVVPISSRVITTKAPTGGTGVIYVSGNPNFFPIEYYDDVTDSYKGVMPKILNKISENTGIDFVYVSAGREDQRLHMASNGQIELVSGLVKDHAEMSRNGITDSGSLLQFEKNGEIYEVCFGFTQIASEEFRSTFEKALSNISENDILRIALTLVMNHETSKLPLWFRTAIFVAAILFTITPIILIIVLHKKKKSMYKDKFTDSTTGIGNKEYFIYTFNRMISETSRLIYSVAYIGFNVTRVNRYYSYDESESQIRFAAKELTDMATEGDIVARIGGGSFAVAHICLEKEVDSWITAVLQRLNRYCEKFGRDYHPDFHAGVYKLMISDHDCEKVITNAQLGYLHAVNNNLPYAVSNIELLNKASEDRQLKKHATEALMKHEFKTYIQFIVNTDGDIIGGEVLSRWQHPQKGLLMPSKYIRVMESEGTIIELDFYMFEESCRQLEKWGKMGYKHFISCNFNRISIGNEHFVSRIKEIAGWYDFNYNNLIIEITENVMEVNKKIAFRNISDCKALGFRIALDDVGSGYTSFSDLREYPIDIIKIDRSILTGATDEQGVALLKGMIALAHNMKMQVLCEGIETEQQDGMLKSIHCDYFQGYYFYRQMPEQEAEKIIMVESLENNRTMGGVEIP